MSDLVDSEGLILEYLLSGHPNTNNLRALVGDGLFIDVDLPLGYQLTDGDCLVFKTANEPEPYHSHSTLPRIQVLSFSHKRDTETLEELARQRAKAISQAFYHAVHDRMTSYFKIAFRDTGSQLLRRPGGTLSYLDFYRFFIKNP